MNAINPTANPSHDADRAELIAAWARFGIKLESDSEGFWQWAETAGDDDPPDWIGIYSPPFSTFEACVSDAEAALGPLPASVRFSTT